MDDIIKRLEKWLKKDQIIARNRDENGFSIVGDIEEAISEINHLRRLTDQSGGREIRRCDECHYPFPHHSFGCPHR